MIHEFSGLAVSKGFHELNNFYFCPERKWAGSDWQSGKKNPLPGKRAD
jgi:hypothetical protein